MQLRPYQGEAVDGVFAWWREHGPVPSVVVIPTAGGKTIVFSSLIVRCLNARPDTRVLILAHRNELIEQAEAKLLAVWPDAPVGVYSAKAGRREFDQITVASRDTLGAQVEAIPHIDLVIIDEAHNIAPAEETRYRKILARIIENNKRAAIVGVTATPYRMGQGFIYGSTDEHLFRGVAYEVGIKQLIDAGYLCPVSAKPPPPAAVADTSGIKLTGGDFNARQLGEAVTESNLVRAAVEDWRARAWNNGRRSTVFFCVSVAHAQMVSHLLDDMGIKCPVVDGGTNSKRRARDLARFDTGEIPAIANCGVLTEGWDAPRLDCVALLRPTQSLALYLQMVGRGLRLHESKRDTLVLDYGENIPRFGPIDTATPPAPRRTKSQPKTIDCASCNEIVSVFKRICPVCGFELKPPPIRLCGQCGEENPVGGLSCIACGYVMVKHGANATNGGILSTERAIDDYRVDQVVAFSRISKSSEAPYLELRYMVDFAESFSQALPFGNPRGRGLALKKWRDAVVPGTPDPETIDEALALVDGGCLRPVYAVSIDRRSKYKDIDAVHYQEDAPA